MAKIKDPENTILMELRDGLVTIELLPDVAPLHCERMKDLVRTGQYDNVAFHLAPVGQACQMFAQNFPSCHMIAAQLVRRVRKALILQTVNSSSTSLTTTF